MSALTDVGTLVGNITKLSLPGVLAACAFAVFLWPPLPVDKIETVEPCSGTCNVGVRAEFVIPDDLDAHKSVKFTESAGQPACTLGKDIVLQPPKTMFDYQAAVENQRALDVESQKLLRCVEQETANQSQETLMVTNIATFVNKLSSDLGNVDTAYQTYAASLNPLESQLFNKLNSRQTTIWELQSVSAILTQYQQERVRRITDLNRQQAIITARQADPGRLRPRQKFDDVVSSLGSHITGFVTLALAWSLLLTPVNQAGFSGLFSLAFKYKWDSLRPDRGPSIKILKEIFEQVSNGAS